MNPEADADLKLLREELIRLRKDVSQLAGTLEEVARHGPAEAKERIRHTVEGLRSDAEKAAESVAHQIEERPVTSALTAFGIGVVLGLLLSARR